MNTRDDRTFIVFDKLLGISVISLSSVFIIYKLFLNQISLAPINLALTVIPFVFLLLCNLKKVNKKMIVLPFILIVVRVIPSLLSFSKLSNGDIIKQLGFDFSYIILGLCVLTINYSKNSASSFHFDKFAKAIIFSVLIFCTYNIFINVSNLIYFSNVQYRYLINFSSFYSNKNLFGEMILLGLFAIHYLYTYKKSFLLNGIHVFFALSLLLTLCRTAILSYCFFVLSSLLLKKNYKKFFYFLIILVFAYLLVKSSYFQIITNYIIRVDEMDSGRIRIWRICFNEFSKSPLLGYGELYISNIINNITGVTGMHSWYLKLLLCGGLFNATLFLVLFYDIFKKSLYLLKRKSNVFCISCITSILVYGLFEEINIFEYDFINLCFTVILLIIPNVMYYQERVEKNEK